MEFFRRNFFVGILSSEFFSSVVGPSSLRPSSVRPSSCVVRPSSVRPSVGSLLQGHSLQVVSSERALGRSSEARHGQGQGTIGGNHHSIYIYSRSSLLDVFNLWYCLGSRSTNRRTDDGRTDDGRTHEKNSDEKIPTKKFRRKNSDEKISDEKKLGARHGGKARPLRRQGTGN